MNPLDPMFEWLLSTTLRASVLAVIILGLQLVLRRWLPAQWRYALWLPMLLVMVLPVLPPVPFGWSPEKGAVPAPLAAPAAAPVVVAPVMDEMMKAPAPVPATPKVNPLPIIWLAGACAVLGAGMTGYRRNMRRILKAVVAPDESLLRSIGMAAQEAGLRQVPRVLVSPMVESPAVTGIFRSSLLLPARFPEGFSEPETRLILLHEFSHLKRHDLAVNGLSCVLQALHWFNPLLWFAFARMRADREAACDAHVLSIGTTDHRADYGSALLKLQTSHPSHGPGLGFVGIFERTAGMKSRIREISGHRRPGFAGRAGGAGIVALLIAFGATKAQEPAAPGAPAREVKKAPIAMTPARTAIHRKLDTIIIPRVNWEDTTFEEGIDFLRLRTVELDQGEPNPRLKGVNFIILLPPADGPAGFKLERVARLEKRNATLREVLAEACQLTGMEYRVEDSGVVITPAGVKGGLNQVESKPVPVGAAADFAAKLIIPRVDFEDTPLKEAVDYLNETARKVAKGGPVFPIVLDPGADPAARIREIRIRNVPLSAALGYCTDATHHTWTADEKGLRVQRKSGMEKVVPQRTPAEEFARKLLVPRVEFVDITLKDAVAYLNETARTAAKGGPVFPVVLDPGADPDARIRELRISNAPLAVVLQYCAEATRHTIKAEDREIRVRGR